MITVESVSKNFNGKSAVDTISFQANDKEILVLLGTSGCGKTTTLKMINRLIEADSGNILINGKNIHDQKVENLRFGLVENDLIYEGGNYQIDFDDLEFKASNPDTKLLLLCNPHNPVGRVWKRSELEKIADICSKHQLIVVSDEIHADLVFEGHQHIPFIAIAENYNLQSVTCGSPCKTFNLAGLPISYIISKNKEILNKIHKTFEVQETSYPNPIAAKALIAAYQIGKQWMEELKIYLYENYQYFVEFIAENLPQIKVLPLEATYLVWLDCRSLNETSEELSKILLEEEKLWVNPGTMYGAAGEGFLRINIGCPKEYLVDGLNRLQRFYLNFGY
ncbi:aminotransferase class I/II-fold pyridoxal phosphate-dependent enzyme [Chryseobacterium sp. G0201]|uniref:aminotransferase class I/II-fold pyridoxal phosphate-dependent enzyme n=1 Tax=Chryseobacterium sp. G0201 TaxID=2487065 RepID=UPI000F4D5FF8|nr:aminotransferase class I/II-fold pyridoxal phosphate-dependent enzyme [Chryseobacterium sp. G0201]AZA55221.1 aminotransferase class I/II-fold pyridoxal phosphate-dependent enzyme [Chryseobacterium sp. G0201]